jgi:hypothetical protein
MTKRAQSKLWRLQSWTDGTRRSYPEPVDPPITTIYRVENNEVGYYLQAYPLYNSGTLGANATTRANTAKADFAMIGGVGYGDFSAEATMISQIRAIRSGVKLLKYIDPRYYYDVGTQFYDAATDPVRLAITTNGAPEIWKAKFADGTQTAHIWSTTNTNGVNWCAPATALNSLGQTIAQAFAARYQEYTQWNIYDGVFLDDLPVIPSGFCFRTDPPGGAPDRNWSYLQNGVNSNIYTDYTFGDAHRSGIRRLVDQMRALKPDYACNMNTDIGAVYTQTTVPNVPGYEWSAGGRPPTPFSTSIFYELVDVSAAENVFTNRGGFGEDGAPNVYPIKGWFSVSTIYLSFEMQRQHVLNASESYFGRQIHTAHQQMPVGSTATPLQIDYDYARACWAMTKMVEGVAYGCSRGSVAPFFLDETCIELGAVVNGPRSMGTLNQPETSSVYPCTFTLRAPNSINGSAQFYWTEFANALVVTRLDNTGLTPGSSNFGGGTAATYTLPSAGAGKKWQRPNASTYVNPNWADLAMQGQNTTLNNGTDATTSSLKPMYGEVFLRVNS